MGLILALRSGDLVNNTLFRFLVVGVACTAVNYVVFYFCLRLLGVVYEFASAIGFLSGVFAGFGLNKSWTFNHKGETTPGLVFKYLAVYVASLAMSVALIHAQVEWLGVSPLIANLVCIAWTTCTNFAGTKLMVFR